MVSTIIISITTFILIALSMFLFPTLKIKSIKLSTYWLIALLGALILLIFSLAPINIVWDQLTSNAPINPIKILTLFFSMTFISIFLDELGLFKYLANVASKKAKGNQYVLFFVLYGLTSLLTVFTSNDIVILTLTPFICFFCKNAKINPLPYLIGEFCAANTWSLMFIIGNPTNIYLATSAGIDFIHYFQVMAIPTLLTGLAELLILFFIFRRKLKEPLTITEETYSLENKPLIIIGLIHLLTCLVFLIISSYINVEMWFVSMICALSLLLISTIYTLIIKKDRLTVFASIKRLPYPLIPFFLSMFVIVVALNYQGISLELAKFLGSSNTIWVYGFSSLVASNIINNIPMSILFSTLLETLPASNYQAGVYASIIGSNLGAFLTPIGALAGLMFMGLVNKQNIKFTFLDFVKYGVIIAIPVTVIALLTLMLFV